MANIQDQITFNIKEAAEMAGVTPATIRNWEKSELIIPKRLENGYRVYTMQDIKHLQQIKQFSIVDKMSIAAIKSLIGKDYPHKNASDNVGITKKMLGEKWKKHRLKKGLSLSEVATEVGITPSYLSKIESANANTSFVILEKLANFYGENILYYFQHENSLSPVISTGKSEKFSIGIPGVVLTARNTLAESNLTVMTYTIDPEKGRTKSTVHHGEEFVYVISGTIVFTLDDDKIYELHEGDSLHFKSIQKHKWFNPSKKINAKILWVYTIQEPKKDETN